MHVLLKLCGVELQNSCANQLSAAQGPGQNNIYPLGEGLPETTSRPRIKQSIVNQKILAVSNHDESSGQSACDLCGMALC